MGRLFQPLSSGNGPLSPEPRGRSESLYDFLKRSDWPESARARDLLEDWLARCPPGCREDLASRLKKKRHHSDSAFFELYLHELLVQIGYVAEPHPALKSRATRPDFRVTGTHANDAFYMEAAVIEPTDDQVRAHNYTNRLLDALDDVGDPNFGLEVTIRGERPTSTIKAEPILASLREWLAKLDPDEVARLRTADAELVPEWAEHIGGLRLMIRPIPWPKGARGSKRRAVMIFWCEFSYGVWKKIRGAIQAKAKRYGDLGAPFIIALNCCIDFGFEHYDVAQALFGQESLGVKVGDAFREVKIMRKPNGVWRGPEGPRNSQVSGLLLFSQIISPWTVAEAQPYLILHPKPDFPFLSSQWCLSVRDVGTREIHEGKPIHEVLGLERGWPKNP